jgi:predicted deacylase
MDNWVIGNVAVPKGEKKKAYLEFSSIQEKLPVFLIHGEQEGPRVLILGGIHGCEYTSIDAALELGKELQPLEVKGKVIVIPIANPSSFYERSIYVHPADKKNLNRVFPGNKDGSDAERLAYCINEHIIKEVDVLIDLHGGDMIEALVPFTIYHVTDNPVLNEQAKTAASLFGINYVVASSGQVPGSTYGIAAEQGKVAVIAEAGQQGILSKEDSELLQAGTKNVLKEMGVLEGTAQRKEVKVLDRFDWYRADNQGLWYPEIRLGDYVQAGGYLGKITDEFGETVQEYTASAAGVVLFLISSLARNSNDPLLAIGD